MSFRTSDPKKLYESLRRDGFVVSLRWAGIRVSPNFYSTEDEVEHLLDYLQTTLNQS